MTKKKSKLNKNIHAVFKVKPIKGTNQAIIKCVSHTENINNMADDPLICNKKNTKLYEKSNVDDYVYNISDTVYARFYQCNILDSYLLTTTTIPVLYASIMYKTQIISGFLFNIYVDFKIESKIKSEKQLIGTNLDGKYQLRIKMNDKDPPKIIELDSFDSYDFIIQLIKDIIETNEMKSIIFQLMEERRKERSERFGCFDNIEIPKPKYNFSKLVEQYKENNFAL